MLLAFIKCTIPRNLRFKLFTPRPHDNSHLNCVVAVPIQCQLARKKAQASNQVHRNHEQVFIS